MGAFDELFGDLAESITDMFVDDTVTITRIRHTYVPTSGLDVDNIEAEIQTKITPPSPFEYYKIDGTTIQTQDVRTYVPAKPLIDAEFDPMPAKDVQILVTIGERVYNVMRTSAVSSGDQDALYELHLRP